MVSVCRVGRRRSGAAADCIFIGKDLVHCAKISSLVGNKSLIVYCGERGALVD